MKSFYFVNGEKTSKETYATKLNEQNLESQLGRIDEIFEAKIIINGQIMDYNKKEEEVELPVPLVYCDKEQIAIEVPAFYDLYSISFLRTPQGKILRIETTKGKQDYSLKDFDHEPTELEKNNGILIFR
ncbi:MAG: hypothetical protein WC376_03115 [Candidatus Nanoarchaeia archaeon]|jgi:hypothetical protein